MPLASINSASVWGIDAIEVQIEVDIARGLPGMTIVGLPDKSVDESRERVRSAIRNVKQRFPTSRLTINLAPADVKKEGSGFDLPIALGILIADEQLPKNKFDDAWIVGELALDGRVRPIHGAIAIAQSAKKLGIKKIYLPTDNALEASLVDMDIYPVKHISQMIGLALKNNKITIQKPFDPQSVTFESAYDLADIKGQEHAKRALEIAAAGGHNLLMSGPPGSGKTMLARTLPTILPPLTQDELVEVLTINSVAGAVLNQKTITTTRPFRSPHHTTSSVAMVGGGTIPKPGEISLSHRGVLFLDELPEFPRSVLEALRQPLEDGLVHISRAHGSIAFPADFQLIAAQNPCPCGYFGDDKKQCICSTISLLKYRKKVSGPLIDRIDLVVTVPAVKRSKLVSDILAESSLEVRKRVVEARNKQIQRFAGTSITSNSQMSTKQLKQFIRIDGPARMVVSSALGRYSLSARSYHRLLKISQTICDLAGAEVISSAHVSEALSYRQDQASI